MTKKPQSHHILLKHLQRSKVLAGKKSTSAGKTKEKSPNTTVQSDTPNVYLVSQICEELPTPIQLSSTAAAPAEEVDHHKSLFYEQLQLFYSIINQRELTRQNQLNSIIEVVKGDVTFAKGDAKQATVHCKYKKNFAVLPFW